MQPANHTAPQTPTRRRLTGGSSSENSQQASFGQFGFFRKPIQTIRANDALSQSWVRILPAFDPTLSPNDQSYKHSFAPYRDKNSGRQDVLTQTPEFSSWYVGFRGHTFLGNSDESIISPLSLGGVDGAATNPMMTSDPIVDMLNVARKDPRFAHLTAKPTTKNDHPILSYPRMLFAVNLLECSPQGQFRQAPHILSGTALDSIKEELSWLRPAAVAVRDPNWPDYQLGDVTCPTHGLFGRALKKNNPSNPNVQFRTLSFAARNGVAPYFNGAPWALPQSVLEQRVDLQDVDNVLLIPTYQEIVDWAVSDGFVPLELIRIACGNKANVAGEDMHASRTSVTMPGMPGMGMPMMPGMSAAPGMAGMPGMGMPVMPGMGGAPAMAGMPGMGMMAGSVGAPAMDLQQETESDEIPGLAGDNWNNPPALQQPGLPAFNPPALPMQPGAQVPQPQPQPQPTPNAPAFNPPAATAPPREYYVVLPGQSAPQPDKVTEAQLLHLPAGCYVSCAFQPALFEGWKLIEEVAPRPAAAPQAQVPAFTQAAQVPQQMAPTMAAHPQQMAPTMAAQPQQMVHQPMSAVQAPGMQTDTGAGPLNEAELGTLKELTALMNQAQLSDPASIEQWTRLFERANQHNQTQLI